MRNKILILIIFCNFSRAEIKLNKYIATVKKAPTKCVIRDEIKDNHLEKYFAKGHHFEFKTIWFKKVLRLNDFRKFKLKKVHGKYSDIDIKNFKNIEPSWKLNRIALIGNDSNEHLHSINLWYFDGKEEKSDTIILEIRDESTNKTCIDFHNGIVHAEINN